jgi:uncharacterized BrkB/YihY/UPF0761 family membrane protein
VWLEQRAGTAATAVNWLNKLPDSQRSPPGLEWWLCKRLPLILGLGTALPLLLGLASWWLSPAEPGSAEERELLLLTYRLIGLVLLHWTLTATVALGCLIVIVMKGPAYVADAYPPPGREQAVDER